MELIIIVLGFLFFSYSGLVCVRLLMLCDVLLYAYHMKVIFIALHVYVGVAVATLVALLLTLYTHNVHALSL